MTLKYAKFHKVIIIKNLLELMDKMGGQTDMSKKMR